VGITLHSGYFYVFELKKTTEQRFWEKVEKTDSCWNWIAATNNGYGIFKLNGKSVRSHRFSYELYKGKIPKGLTIDHLCRNRKCVNSEHLEAVTQKVNVLRGISIQAINARKIYCINGHKFTPENTMKRKTGRMCRICFYNTVNKYKQSKILHKLS